MKDNNQKQNPNKEKPNYANNPSGPNRNEKENEKKFRQGDRNSGCGC